MGTAPTEADESTTSTDDHDAVSPASGTGLDSNVAGALSYLLGFVTGIVFYVLEPDDEFVRFHAAQSIVTFGIVLVVSFVVGTVVSMLTAIFVSSAGVMGLGFVWSLFSMLFGLVWLVFGLGTLALWLFLMLRAYQGETPRLPFAANLADQLV